MPSMITHDLFAKDLLEASDLHLAGEVERAFLLGAQGPDPLYFLRFDPRYAAQAPGTVAQYLHTRNTVPLLASLRRCLRLLPATREPAAHAYAAGFLAHYALDSKAHPLVYALEYRICDAGVEGLTRQNKGEVHHAIEHELDEVLLYQRTGETVAAHNPGREILQGARATLDAAGELCAHVVGMAYHRKISEHLYGDAVRAYRTVERLLWSPTGRKRAVLGAIEESARPFSLVKAFTHRPLKIERTWFANDSRHDWENPFTGELTRKSFMDLYDEALLLALDLTRAFEEGPFDEAAVRTLTGGVNFDGDVPSDLYEAGAIA